MPSGQEPPVVMRARRRAGAAVSRLGQVAARPTRDELIERLDALERRLEELVVLLRQQEERARRDLVQALDVEAARSTAAFIERSMPTARAFHDMRDTLRHGLSLAPADGLALEFGVASGSTLRVIAEARQGVGVFGFDSFEGLPEDWRTGFHRGLFAVESMPEVPGATLVPGLFQESLPRWLAEHPEPVAFLHMDADLYSSTAFVLDRVGDRLMPDAVVVFDEFFNYPGWADHEYRAWMEFVERHRLAFRYEAYTANHEQVVIRLGRG